MYIIEILDTMGPAWIPYLTTLGPWNPIEEIGEAAALAKKLEDEGAAVFKRLWEQYQQHPRWMRLIRMVKNPGVPVEVL